MARLRESGTHAEPEGGPPASQGLLLLVHLSTSVWQGEDTHADDEGVLQGGQDLLLLVHMALLAHPQELGLLQRLERQIPACQAATH